MRDQRVWFLVVTAIVVQTFLFLESSLSIDLDSVMSYLADSRLEISAEVYLFGALAVGFAVIYGLRRYIHSIETADTQNDSKLVNLFCPECGRQLREGESFCCMCGNDLEVKMNTMPRFIDRVARNEPEFAGKH